jgi:hypothetical protein
LYVSIRHKVRFELQAAIVLVSFNVLSGVVENRIILFRLRLPAPIRKNDAAPSPAPTWLTKRKNKN